VFRNVQRLSVLALAVALAVTLGLPAVASANHPPRNGTADLTQRNGSGISGTATLHQLSDGGTHIEVHAFGLTPGHHYISLYYSTTDCSQPDFANDQIGPDYTGNHAGHGHTHGTADDNLTLIHSVSVRDASTHNLLACGTVTTS
jgi:hypothetical protein